MREVPNQELFTQRRFWKRVLYYVRIAEQIRDYLHNHAYDSVCCIMDLFSELAFAGTIIMKWGRGRQAHHQDKKKAVKK